MADPIVVAASAKWLELHEGSEMANLISQGKKLEGDAYEIATDETIDAKLQTAKGEREGKHSPLADRLIVKVSEARTRGEAEAALRGER